MSKVSELASGKGHRDENFPVASALIAPRHRGPILAFYRFARAADDVADNPDASREVRLTLLSRMGATLSGDVDENPEALALRQAQDPLGLSAQHGLDLLEAFRCDVSKSRYATWDELMDYCRLSAAPVGRFVLDVHGESRDLWPANDALCSALQIINHLQDCAKDYRDLNRVYIPTEEFTAARTGVEALAERAASPALKRVIADLARRTGGLLAQSRVFSGQIRDRRLGTEVAIIQRLAEDLDRRLMRCDPLSERVHHSRFEMVGLGLHAVARSLIARPRRPGRLSS